MKLKALDILAIALSFAVVAAFSVAAYGGRGAAGQVVVESSGARYFFPLGQDRVERIPGPRGDTIVEVHAGSARVIDSPCPDKVCVASGSISRTGQWIACLPNRVLVRIEGRGEPTVDGTAF